MKKDVIPEIPEDARAMFPVDPRILVRRAPSRDFVAILERGVTLVFTRVGVETRIGSAPPRRGRGERPPRLEALILSRLTLNPSPPAPRRLRRSRARARDARGEPRERDVARRDDAAARRVRRACRGERGVPRRGGFRERARSRALRHHLLPAQRCARDAAQPRLPLLPNALRGTSGRAFPRLRTTRTPLTTASRRSTRRATLRQVYHICETQGRIALKRTSPPRF